MVIPSLEIVEFQGVGILWGEQGVAVGDAGGVADVLEGVHLTTKGSLQTAGVVDLNLLSLA